MSKLADEWHELENAKSWLLVLVLMSNRVPYFLFSVMQKAHFRFSIKRKYLAAKWPTRWRRPIDQHRKGWVGSNSFSWLEYNRLITSESAGMKSLSFQLIFLNQKSNLGRFSNESKTNLTALRTNWTNYCNCIITRFGLVHVDISTIVLNVLIEQPFGDLASITASIKVSISAAASPLATTLLSLCRWFPSLRKKRFHPTNMVHFSLRCNVRFTLMERCSRPNYKKWLFLVTLHTSCNRIISEINNSTCSSFELSCFDFSFQPNFNLFPFSSISNSTKMKVSVKEHFVFFIID